MSTDSESGADGEQPQSSAVTDPQRILTEAVELDKDASEDRLNREVPYLGTVTNPVEYGVFIALTPSYGSDITGLVHRTELPPKTEPHEYRSGDRMVVELADRREDGDLSFRGLHSPDVSRGPELLDIQRELSEISDTLETLASEDEPDGDSEGPRVCEGIHGALRELTKLHGTGYTAESVSTESREGGDVVEVNVTVSSSGDGDE